jgi:hypothetical protein
MEREESKRKLWRKDGVAACHRYRYLEVVILGNVNHDHIIPTAQQI